MIPHLLPVPESINAHSTCVHLVGLVLTTSSQRQGYTAEVYLPWLALNVLKEGPEMLDPVTPRRTRRHQ